VNANWGKEMLKINVLSRSEEKDILDFDKAFVKHLSNLNKHFTIFAHRIFLLVVEGNFEIVRTTYLRCARINIEINL